MSSDDNKNTNSAASTTSGSEDKSFSMPSIPTDVDMSSFRQGLSKGIHSLVQGTNAALAQLQTATKSVQQPVSTAIAHTEDICTQVATQTRVAYERRHEFGPYYVAGATVTVGSITALRRGKIPGVTLGVLAGGFTYLALYNMEPWLDAPDFTWPSFSAKDLTDKLPKELTDKLPSFGSDSKKD
mgnify:CR=1 FL=1